MDDEIISKAHMRGVDRLYWDPAERASGILSMINSMRDQLRKKNIKAKRRPGDGIPTDWDLLCFAVEYVGAQAVALQDQHFLNIAIHAERWLYSAHYSNPSKIYGAPDRKKEKKGDEAVQGEGPKQAPKIHRSDESRDHDPGTGDHEEPPTPQGEGGGD